MLRVTLRTQKPYHKLVKTTPNPSATKNRRGELVALEPPSSPLLPVVVAELLDDEVVEGGISVKRNEYDGCCWCASW